MAELLHHLIQRAEDGQFACPSLQNLAAHSPGLPIITLAFIPGNGRYNAAVR